MQDARTMVQKLLTF